MAQNLVIRFDKIVDDHSGQLQIGIKETSNLNDLMTLKVYDFPFIGLVWIGIIVMVFGFLMSVYQRIQKARTQHRLILFFEPGSISSWHRPLRRTLQVSVL